jgi:flagellar protein FliT
MIMETVSPLAPFEHALSQSQALLSLAQAGDWESFETLVQQRQQGLLDIQDATFLEAVAAAQLESQAALIIQAIQSINKQLTLLAEAHRADLASDLRQASKAVKAIDAYSR